MNNCLKVLLTLTFLLSHCWLSAQVTSVNYLMKYDENTGLYNVCIVINSGSSTIPQHRVQFNAQMTIVVPSGVDISIDTLFMPLEDNFNYTGTIPTTWFQTISEIGPPITPELSYHAISPNLSPVSLYNDLNTGDTICLFGVSVSEDLDCGQSIRFFNNETDPTSADFPGGGDFTNGFTIGGIEQLYQGNLEDIEPSGPEISFPDIFSTCHSDPIQLNALPVGGIFSGDGVMNDTFYPQGLSGVVSIQYDFINEVNCLSTATSNITVLDTFDAGLNQVLDCVVFPGGSTYMKACGLGYWETGSWNPGTANIGDALGPNTTVEDFSLAGVYTFYWKHYTNGSIIDSVKITVNEGVFASVVGQDTICYLETTQLSPSTGVTWSSEDPGIATVTNSGLVTGLFGGTVDLIATNNSTGCESNPVSITVHPMDDIEISGPTEICIGSTSQLFPEAGGTWSSSNPIIATISNSGLVTAINSGFVTFCFTSSTTLCTTCTYPEGITVVNQPIVAITGDYEICVGETTTLAPSTGGTWTSSDPLVATINNAGIVTGNSPGVAHFYFTALGSGCVSDQSEAITVLSPPSTEFLGSDLICVGGTTTVSPMTGGTWTSSNTSVAAVSNSGLVTGISPGIAHLVFTETLSGCQSFPLTLTVVNEIVLMLTGADNICVGQTSSMSPTTGGTWASSDATIATIKNTGIITGVGAGVVSFCYTNSATGCISCTNNYVLTVNTPGIIELTGPSNICVGQTSSMSPTTGGTWVSNSPGVATVTNAGIITGVSPGVVSFCYTNSTTGCISCTVGSVLTVNTPGVVEITGPYNICVGSTTTLSPTTGGTWVSNNPAVALVTNDGVVVGISQGTVSFCFTDSATGCIECSPYVIVDPKPTVSVSDHDICIGFSATLSPSSGGVWTALSPGIASLTNGNIVNGISSGVGEFEFLEASTGCVSHSLYITVEPNPIVDLIGPSTICIGGTTTLSPSSGGYWVSADDAIATVTNNGIVTGIASGTTTFCFTDAITGCTACTIGVIVNNESMDAGPDQSLACVNLPGGSVYMEATGNGIWTSSSSNPGIVTVINIDDPNTEIMDFPVPGEYIFIWTEGICSDEVVVIITEPADAGEDQTVNCSFTPGGVSMSATGVGIWTASGSNPGPVVITDVISPTTSIQDFPTAGVYIFTWTVGNCSDEVSITVTDQIDAGPDQVVECDLPPDGIVTMAAAGIGSWTASGSNPGASIITDVTNPSTTIQDFSVEGNYTYNWTNGNCSDEVTVTVDCYDPCEDEQAIPTISGIAFIDQNGNGVQDEDEYPLRNVLIYTTPGDLSIITDMNGAYSIEVDHGNYDVTASINDGDWEEFEITQLNVAVDQPCVQDVNFGFVPIPFTGIGVSVANTIVRCDQSTIFYLTVENFGATSHDARLVFDFDSRTDFELTNAFSYTQNGNSIEILTGPLAPFAPKTFIVALHMPPISFPIPLLQFTATTYTLNGELQQSYSYVEEIRCSYDPNDKRVHPDRDTEANLTLFDEDLEYTIRFQNNGNDTAFQVKIVDPLDPNIDQRSIRLVSSSHPVETCIENDTLIFLFKDIMLVDSMTNYLGSQGYVTYKCNTLPGLDELSEVHNKADIIFDLNPPIITNEVVNTMLSEFCSDITMVKDVNICFGESYLGHTESGTYVYSTPSPFGCDSIFVVNLDVQQIGHGKYVKSACVGSVINYQGTEYTTTGIYQDTSYNSEGCISSIVELDLTFHEPIDYNFPNLNLCIGSTSIFNPGLQGAWISSKPDVVSVSADGGMAALTQGSSEICFTDLNTQCTECFVVIVDPTPTVALNGSETLCVGETSIVAPGSGGVWNTNNASVATVSNNGIITAIGPGSCDLSFTESSIGCVSSPISISVLPDEDPDCIVSTQDEEINDIVIYPNPATELFTIESHRKIDNIQILSITGKSLHSVVMEYQVGRINVQTHNIKPGIYIITLIVGERHIFKKVIIK